MFGIERGIEAGSANALGCERVHLVAHQCNERGNNERKSVQQQRWKLIAERFSAACGEDGECGSAVEQSSDHRFLALTEGCVAEMVAEGFKHAMSIEEADGERQAGSGFFRQATTDSAVDLRLYDMPLSKSSWPSKIPRSFSNENWVF